MPVTARIKGVEQLAIALSSMPSGFYSGVKIRGQVNFIKAMVWDLGYVTRVIKPGPKTMWSVNVYGDPKVLTITAPTGFIRIGRGQYMDILREEFSNANFPRSPISQWPKLIETMMANAAQRCAEIVANAAPVDSGDLRSSISAALPGDSSLTEGATSQGTFDVADWLIG